MVLSLFLFSNAFANEKIQCPSSLTCNYGTGTCDINGWVLDISEANEPFIGEKNIPISKIIGRKVGSTVNTIYEIRCSYAYVKSSMLSIYTYVNDLVGTNWRFSGFGNQTAECSMVQNSTDTSYCAGERI